MLCRATGSACRRDHIALRYLDCPEPDGADWSARCIICGHPTFRISAPDRSNRFRHIWTCACRSCGCSGHDLRVTLLQAGADQGCLGLYDGNTRRSPDPETARRLLLAADDILAAPHLRPAYIRIILAEARGQKVPDVYTELVAFLRGIGVSKASAQDAAKGWLGL